MEAANENHLLRIHSYLLKKLPNRKDANIIRTELLTRYHLQFPESSTKLLRQTKMCPRCFSLWGEGNFSIKFEKKKVKKTKEKDDVKIKYVIECLLCHKTSEVSYKKPVSQKPAKKLKPKQRHASIVAHNPKIQSISSRKPYNPKTQSISYKKPVGLTPTEKQKPNRRRAAKSVTVQRKKQKTNPLEKKKKSNLTMLNEIL